MPSGEGGIQCTDKQNARINSGGGEYSIVKKEQNELGLGFGCGNDGAMVMVKGGEGEKDENARKRKKRRIEVAEDTRTVKMAKWEISNGKEFGEQVVSNCDLTVEMETDNSHYLGNVDISTGEVTVEMTPTIAKRQWTWSPIMATCRTSFTFRCSFYSETLIARRCQRIWSSFLNVSKTPTKMTKETGSSIYT